MIVPYKDVSASALRLNLVAGIADITTLHPIHQAVLTQSVGGADFRVEIGILGASHYGIWAPAAGQDAITEVFVCSEVGPADRRIYLKPLDDDGRMGPCTHSLLDGGWIYSFSAWTEPWSGAAADSLRQLARRVALAGKESPETSTGLMFRFPAPQSGQTDQTAETVVFLEGYKDWGMHLHTIHSYPNDGVLVVSESKLVKA